MILPPPVDKYDRVAFFGPMASGKSYCASHLVTEYGYTKLSFASKLKEIAADLFEVTGKDREGRRVLQQLGSSVRHIKADTWITYALKHVEVSEFSEGTSTPRLVVDDLRYENEADALREEGFMIIRAFTPERTRRKRIETLYPDTDPDAHDHESETGWHNIDPDFIITSITPDAVAVTLDDILSGLYEEKEVLNGTN